MPKITNYGLGLLSNAVLSILLARVAKADTDAVSVSDLASELDEDEDTILSVLEDLTEKGHLQKTNLQDWAETATFQVGRPVIAVTPLQMSLSASPEQLEGIERLREETSVDVEGGDGAYYRCAVVPEKPDVPKGTCLLTIAQQDVDKNDLRIVVDMLRCDTRFAAIAEAKRILGLDEPVAESGPETMDADLAAIGDAGDAHQEAATV